MFPSDKHSAFDTESSSNSKIVENFERKWETLYETAESLILNIKELGGILDDLDTFGKGDI